MKHEDKLIVTNSSFEKIYKTNKNKLSQQSCDPYRVDNSQKLVYSGNKLKSWKRTDNKRTLTES